METKANYVAVGAFSLIVLAAAVAFIYWLYTVDTGAESAQLDIRIEGSVTGLTNGSPVKFNGIDVGAIRRIDFDPENPRQVIARAIVRSDLPISSETSAVLAFTGLTGIAHIELRGGNV
ncbi:MAG: MlaD family protein, partial [Pseudomonadota bacterium]